MKLRFDEITRGNGKIYIRAWADDSLDGLTICASATTRDGTALPVTTRRCEDGHALVAILAVFRVGQRLELQLVNEEGTVVAHASRYLTPFSARAHSSFNTLRGNADAEAIRNIDDRRPSMSVGAFITFDEYVYQFSPEQDIVHGTLRAILPAQDSLMGKPTLRFYDQLGTNVCDDWISLGTSQHPLFGGSLYTEYLFNFSIRIPTSTLMLACWASIPTSSGALSHLACLREDAMMLGRQHWGGLIDSAQTSCVYHEWFLQKQRPSDIELQTQRAVSFAIEPTFSIVVPLSHTPLDHLAQMADSVLAQTYDKLELILVNSSPDDQDLSASVAALAQRDSRVVAVPMGQNEGMAGSTCVGMHKAKGDFVALLDHGDVIEPDLLYCYVTGINRHPTTDLLYCDEDILQNDRYVNPLFKPDWSPNLLTSMNYVRHMLAVRRSIAEELPRDGIDVFEGSQDYHLALFASERARNVHHVRKALYHARPHGQPAALSQEANSRAEDAGVRALQAHFNRCHIDATVHRMEAIPDAYHVDYAIHDNPLVSIIIPNKDMVPVLEKCLASILEKSTYQHYEVVVVENNSTDPETFSYYDSLPGRDARLRVVHQPSDGSFNFSRTVNYGVKHARGDYLLLLNNDTEVISPDWIQTMLGHAQRNEVGVVGAKLLYPDGLIQHAGVVVHKQNSSFHLSVLLPANTSHHHNFVQLTRDFSAVTAACMLTKRSSFEAVGGFDEYLAVDYNDTDYCLRLRQQGLLVVYEPSTVLMHHESISRGAHSSIKQRVDWAIARGIIMQRWPHFSEEGDPLYSPNFGDSAYYHLEP